MSGGATIDICDNVVTRKKYVTGYDEWRICADPPGGIPPWQEHEGGGAGGGAGQWHAGSSGGGGRRPARPDAGLLALLRSLG